MLVPRNDGFVIVIFTEFFLHISEFHIMFRKNQPDEITRLCYMFNCILNLLLDLLFETIPVYQCNDFDHVFTDRRID